MKRLICIVGMIALLSSCNQKEIENLTYENQRLDDRVEELESQLQLQIEEIQEKTEKIEQAESQLYTCSQVLMLCQINFDGYKYGNLKSLTRYVEGQGLVTIYGAQNIIDFLNDHYVP